MLLQFVFQADLGSSLFPGDGIFKVGSSEFMPVMNAALINISCCKSGCLRSKRQIPNRTFMVCECILNKTLVLYLPALLHFQNKNPLMGYLLATVRY